LSRAAWRFRIARVYHEADRLGVRYQVAQQAEPFRAQLIGKERNAGDIAARPAQISDEPLFHRICTGVEYHGNCGGRVLPCLVRGWSTHSSDYVDVAADEVGRELRETLGLGRTPAVF